MNFRSRAVAQGVADRAGGSAANEEATKNISAVVAHYLVVALRRRWLILGTIAVALAASLIITILTTPSYTARSSIEIRRENDNIVRVEGVEPKTGLGDMEFYQTQYGLLQSRSLAERVATELSLFDDQKFFAMYHTDQANEWFEGGRVRPGASTRDERIRKAGDILLANLSIAPVRLSRLVDVYFSSPDPIFAARVVNAWGKSFIRITLQRRFEATSDARLFLEQRLGQIRGRLDESERALVGYASRQNIVNLPAGAAGGTERSIVSENLAILTRQLAEATADRVAAETRADVSDRATSESLQNPAINGIRQRRAQRAAEYESMMTQFEPEYPPAIALRREIEDLDRALTREEARVGAMLRGTVKAARDREAGLSRRADELKAGLLDLRRRSIQYNILQREVDTNRQLYDGLLQRYKEIGIAGGVGVNNISVVDPGRVPQVPSSPRVVLNLALALLLGSIAGFGLALLLEQFEDAISDPEELEVAIGVPTLGAVPKTRQEDPYQLIDDRKSDLSEAYLAIQTSLSFCTDHGVPSSLAVTSTRPGEGKSTTAHAIARSLSRTGRKVILVDGDMRSPSVHHHTGLENAQGLSNFLAGNDDLAAMIVHSEEAGIAVLPAGPQPPSAAELLSGERVVALLSRLRGSYDHVVIDSPPVMGLADAPLIANHVEATVFVIESSTTKLSQVRLALSRLGAAQARIVGAVLTKFEPKRSTYGYGYEYGYGYGRSAEQA